MKQVLLVRYAEIHLKGLNRPYFERMLVDRMRDALQSIHARIEREQGRVFVYDIPEDRIAEASEKICGVFGVHSVSPALCVEKNWEAISKAAISLVASDADKPQSFKCFAKRSDKRFPMSSEQIC